MSINELNGEGRLQPLTVVENEESYFHAFLLFVKRDCGLNDTFNIVFSWLANVSRVWEKQLSAYPDLLKIPWQCVIIKIWSLCRMHCAFGEAPCSPSRIASSIVLML